MNFTYLFKRFALIFILIGLTAVSANAQNIIYVDSASTAADPDGTSWTNAFTHPDTAVAAAQPGDSIWIAGGTYVFTETLTPTDSVAIYGGLAGDEPADYDLSQRDFETNETILDGEQDLNITGFILDGDIGIRFDGLSFVNFFDGTIDMKNNSEAAVIKSTFTENAQPANEGGAVRTLAGSNQVTIINSAFRDNLSTPIGLAGASHATIINSLFTGNEINGTQRGVINITADDTGSLDIINTTIANNPAEGIVSETLNSPAITITNSILWNNNLDNFDSDLTDDHLIIDSGAPSFDVSHTLIPGGVPAGSGFTDSGNNLDPPNPLFNYEGTCPSAFSESIDAGDDAALPADDFDIDHDGDTTEPLPLDLYGNPRTAESAIDVGAVEFVEGGLNCLPDGNTIYVTPGGAGDGSSWGNAFGTIADAMNAAAAGDQIWVQKGDYLITETIDLKDGVAVYGGFEGDETVLTQRNPDPDSTVIDGDSESITLLRADSTHISTRVDGFTLTGGFNGGIAATGGTDGIPHGALTLVNLHVHGNTRFTGGGINTQDTFLAIANSRFFNNVGSNNGGAVTLNANSPFKTGADIRNTTFVGNRAQSGAGFYSGSESRTTLINAVFAGNTASLDGGAVNIVNNLSELHSINTIFWDNSADGEGDNLFFDSSAEVELTNNLIAGGISGTPVQTNTVTTNPRFVRDPDPDNDDFGDLRLVSGSPAIDAGDNSFIDQRDPFDLDYDGVVFEAMPADLAGDTRIQEGTVNIGAYETIVELELGSELARGSLQFDGTDGYIDLSTVADDITGVTDFSVEFWMKGNKNAQSGAQSALAGIHDSEGNDKLILTTGDGSTQDGLIHLFDGVSGTYVIDGVVPVGDDQWHHIAVVQHTTDDSIYVYVDGKPDGSFGTTGVDLADTDLWSFGQEYDGVNTPSDFFNGSIDEVRVWSRALDGEEIRRNMFQALEGDENGLASLLTFYEGAGTVVTDESSNGNEAVFEGGVSWSDDGHPYGTFITGDEGWRMMTSPGKGTTYGELLDSLWTQGFTGADAPGAAPNVFVWNEGDGAQDTTARGWQPLTDASVVPDPGEGFIVYVYDDQDFDGTPDGFPKSVQVDSAQHTGTVTPALSLTKQGGTYESDRDGWNLVGNPYGATIDWDAASGWDTTGLDASFYVWSDSAGGGAGSYLSWNGALDTGTLPDGRIAPLQGFWIKADDSGAPALEMTDEVRSAGGVFYKEQPTPQIGFELVQCNSGHEAGRQAEISSKAVVMFHNQAVPGKDRLDAWKLQSLNQQYLSLYTIDTERHALDINALPMELESPLELHRDFKGSDLGGEYTLSWKPQDLPDSWTEGSIKLIDLHTDRILNLNKAGEYSFEVNKAKTSKVSKTLEVSKPVHGPVPTVLKAKATNPRFVLNINPNAAGNPLGEIPEETELAQNYPNPFNPETVIRYGVPEQAQVQLDIYDVLGRRVQTLINEQKLSGRYEINFDGSSLASGLYFYKLKVGAEVLTKKMMLIK